MQTKSVSAPLALAVAVVSLAVLTAGCIQQDRPHELTFTVAADAGGAVVETGQAAHLEWSEHEAVEVEDGGHLAEAPEIDWETSQDAHGAGPNFSFTPTEEGLVLVEVKVTAEHHSASDVGGVLVIPSGSAARRIYVAIVGDAQLGNVSGLLEHRSSSFGDHHGHYYASSAAGDAARFTLAPLDEGSRVSLLIAVKQAGGSLKSLITHPVDLDGTLHYTLVVDAAGGTDHRLEVRGGLVDQDIELKELAAGEGEEGQVRVLVAPAGQKLPGFESLAAVAAFAGIALCAALRRRL